MDYREERRIATNNVATLATPIVTTPTSAAIRDECTNKSQLGLIESPVYLWTAYLKRMHKRPKGINPATQYPLGKSRREFPLTGTVALSDFSSMSLSLAEGTGPIESHTLSAFAARKTRQLPDCKMPSQATESSKADTLRVKASLA